MIVTIHQPEHLPWLGFLAKAASAERLILLDTVPYRHHYFQNRNRVLFGEEPGWLTVPVKHRGHLKTAIAGIEIDDARPWKRKYVGRLGDAFRRAPHGEEVVGPLTDLIEGAGPSLAELNIAIIEWVWDLFALAIPVRRASEMEARGEASRLLADLCEEAGAATYLAGPSGRDYLERDSFASREIEIRFFDFSHPTYPQQGDEFVPGLSALDLVANVGSGEAREVLGRAVRNSVSVLE